MFQKKAKYYTNIDECPIIIYDKVNETQNLANLAYEGKAKLKEALKHWETINNEIFWEFGLNPKYAYILRLKKDLCRCIHEYYVKGMLSSKPMIKYFEYLIKEESKGLEVNKENIGKICAKLSKNNGFMIDPAKISVRMFFSMVND